MLSRAAQRTLRRDALEGPARIAAQQLTLPWLCPALSRRSIYSSSAPSTPTDSPRRRRKSLSSPTTTTRSLATTAELQPAPSPSPFAGFAQAWGSRAATHELATLRPWDSSNPLILHDQLPVPTQRTPASLFGVGSDAVELHQNLYACLRVGRTDRAAIILRRLSELYAADAPELLDASNAYLQTLFELTQQDPSPDSLTTIEHWYNVNMVRNHVSPNAQTFVTLLRATMAFSADEKAMQSAVQKYMAIAFEHGKQMVEEINYSPEFTDEEWDTLIRLQPDEFDEPPPVAQVQEMLASSPAAQKNLIEHGLLAAGSMPEIKPVQQKGLGLQTLQDSLDVFYHTDKIAYPEDMEGSREEKDGAYAYARQIRMEEDAYEAAVQRWKAEDENMRAMGVLPQMGSAPIQALMYRWYVALVPVFKAEIAKAKAACDDPNPENKRDMLIAYAPWLEQCPPERLAALTISRVVRASLQGKSKANNDAAEAPSKISSLSVAIGNDIREYLNSTNKARHGAFVKKQRREMRLEMLGKLSREQGEANTRRSSFEMTSFDKIEIPVAMRVSLGAFALELLMQTATITVHAQHPKTGKDMSMTQAAFQHNMGYQMGKRVGYIAPHHQLLERLRRDRVTHIQAVRLPMVVEPKPWASFENGGYYTIPQKVVRQKNNDPSQVQYAKSAIENGDMKQVLSGLDVLGKVPWQINTSVLKVMTEAWNKGMGIAGLVPEELELARPEEPGPDATPQMRAKWGKAMAQYENEKGGYHSQKCFQNFQLETARSFAQEKQIFFPHSVDFRGRAYPIPPTLNHIGADLARGLLVFANGKELGTAGLQWLKIHLANVYGYDKASLKDREQFAMDNLSAVYDSATNPLDGRQWWTKAEDPWQALATCIELKNALDSPDPSRYMSQLPVHQDGTCNGLQHYAALGGDSAGARQVNLEPSDKPQDIYTGVADLVKEMVAEDAAQGHPHAKFIDGHITRKIVKRTVMTNVYGVTFIGAKDQVQGELRNVFPNFKETAEVRSLGQVALYIAYKIFDALGKIFNGAQEIQHWLGVCGERITTSLSTEQIERIQQSYEGGNVGFDPKYKKSKMTKTDMKQLTKLLETFKTSIIWTTPLQMPIVQPYRKDSSVKVQSKMQGISINKPDPNGAIDKRKQLQAFPPNFIHSLDATHMLLSALKCNEVGMDFAAVHDSFWTHASDISNLNVILRDAFVRMHSEDIITRLAEEFKARYAGAMYCATLLADTEVAHMIRAWRRGQAKNQRRRVTADDARHGDATLGEIALEAKRQQLLTSEDAEEVEQGKKMVTPTSIWLDNENPAYLASARMSLLGDKDRIRVSKRELKSAGLHEAAAEANGDVNAVADGDALEERTVQTDKKSPYYKGNVLKVWVPLTFPDVPKKGDWDIGRLRESEYFFS